jgi:hypothetical protein
VLRVSAPFSVACDPSGIVSHASLRLLEKSPQGAAIAARAFRAEPTKSGDGI